MAHARARLPKRVLEFLVEDACGDAASPPATWRGFRLRALDGPSPAEGLRPAGGTMVSMPREDELVRHFGLHRTKHGEVRYPLARFVSLLNLGPGELVLLDRELTGSPTMARILARGAEFLGRKNARLRTDKVKVVDRLGRDDWIVELPVSKTARKEDPSLPKAVRVRLFKARWKSPSGERLVEWFVTSLADRRRFKKHAMAKLYHERWRIETSYEEFKVMFHSDVLRSKTVENVNKEFTSAIGDTHPISGLTCQPGESTLSPWRGSQGPWSRDSSRLFSELLILQKSMVSQRERTLEDCPTVNVSLNRERVSSR